MAKEPIEWRYPLVTQLEDDNCAVIFSDDGPDGTHSVMRVWFEPDDNFRVRSVKLSMPGRIKPTELRTFPWDRWLELADWGIRLPNMRTSDPPLVPKNDASPDRK